MEKKAKNSITKNAILKVILNVFNVIIPIITGPYLARTLDVELYGIYNKSLSLVGILLPFAGFGIYNYGIREISRVKNDKKKLSSLFTILFTVGCISSLIILIFYIIYLGVAQDISYEIVYYAMALQILASMFNVEYMNEAYENYSFIVYKTLLVRILNVVLILLCVKQPDDILIYAIIYSGLQFLNYFLSFFYIKFIARISFVKVSLVEIRKIIKPLAIMFILMNCNMLYTNLDRLFMTGYSDGVYVTYYTFSQTIVNLVTNVLNSIILVTIPRLSYYFATERQELYNELVQKSTSVFFMLSIPLCFGFYILSNVIMFLYGGTNYIAAGKTFGIFSLRMLIWLLDYVLVNQILFIQGYEKVITKMYFFGGGINIVLKIVLVLTNNLTSETAIFTTAISEAILIILEIITIKRGGIEGTKGLLKKYLKYFIVSICFIPIGWLNQNLFHIEYVLNLDLIKFVIVVVAESVCFYFTFLAISKDDTFINCVQRIFEKLKKKR